MIHYGYNFQPVHLVQHPQQSRSASSSTYYKQLVHALDPSLFILLVTIVLQQTVDGQALLPNVRSLVCTHGLVDKQPGIRYDEEMREKGVNHQ
ncbi:hypothetical protein BPA01_12330 [Brevibacillus parabrevis]|uniref:Uncharacterized protein n=1 Tax=Brevibacillus parabrevis TaxID=54914 RepID=A0A4Y3PDL1_BREPA|nr:hypothetical protein BPA01_12330 [Brevibacillus parabrevis]